MDLIEYQTAKYDKVLEASVVASLIQGFCKLLSVAAGFASSTEAILTRFSKIAIHVKGPDKPLAYRESNMFHLYVTRPPEIYHIPAASSYTICR